MAASHWQEDHTRTEHWFIWASQSFRVTSLWRRYLHICSQSLTSTPIKTCIHIQALLRLSHSIYEIIIHYCREIRTLNKLSGEGKWTLQLCKPKGSIYLLKQLSDRPTVFHPWRAELKHAHLAKYLLTQQCRFDVGPASHAMSQH